VIKGYLSNIGTNTETICWKEWIEKVQVLPFMETTPIPNLSLIKNKTAESSIWRVILKQKCTSLWFLVCIKKHPSASVNPINYLRIL
jgi:hypothetical protein